ncbi:hypothetical protein DFH08DRAFT_705238, partial [Mycena albidolilacea]
LQRHEMLLHTGLKVKQVKFASVALQFTNVSPTVVKEVSKCVAKGESAIPRNKEECKIPKLLKQVNGINSLVPGSSAAHVAMWNEIRGLMIEKGLSSF